MASRDHEVNSNFCQQLASVDNPARLQNLCVSLYTVISLLKVTHGTGAQCPLYWFPKVEI